VDFGCGHEGADAPAALDDAFAFQRGQRVPRGHQTDFVDLREVSFRSNDIARPQVAGVNALTDDA